MSAATDAVLCLNKPYGWTSFDVVARVRKLYGGQKVGHAGTLDPLATGVLVVCVGRATRQIASIQEQTKAYVAQVYLGAITASYDAEQPPQQATSALGITEHDIRALLPEFTGPILQIPPVYSAIKLGGQPVYSHARNGVDVKLEPRPVHIYELELLGLEAAPSSGLLLTLRVLCSKGTYIRSLASDLGSRLGVGGFLAGLTRTAVGSYTLAEALSLQQLAGHLGKPEPPAPRQVIQPHPQCLALMPWLSA